MKIILIILIGILTLSLIGCDYSLEIVGIGIREYPERISYQVGEERELDLTGGRVYFIAVADLDDNEDIGNSANYSNTSDIDMTNQLIVIKHQIDFNKPGVYNVTLEYGEVQCNFPIEVIE